ncbi:MAG: restriction endonuclease subunit S [Candidatus Electrothrix sp. GW3-4]|uniref:restriction endonuclease subunit S n=1 Tax=Candidatus Electrothrix sp. GW3-4 TaxID=3126740 RepID=UPI0030CBCB68
MGGEWRQVTWGDLATLEYGKGLRGYKNATGDYRVFGTNGPIGWHSEPLCKFPSVIVGRKGAYRGIHFSPEPFFVIDTAFYLKPKEGFDIKWAYYELLIHDINNMDSGSAIPSTSRDSFYTLPVLVPPEKEQKAIAHVLGTLDDRIELNRRMNETLEAMAQALFKSWFVDFDPVIDNALASGKEIPEELSERAKARAALGDKRKPLPEEIRSLFPDEFAYSDVMGWIPKGWEGTIFNELIELTGGGTPKTSVDEYWNGDIPWFSVVDAPRPADVFVVDTEKHITQLGVDNSSTKILPVGATIISARGTVGKCALVGRPMAMNQSCYGIRGKRGLSDSFIYFAVRQQVEHLQRGGHGSVFNTITRDTFKIIKVANGRVELTQKYEESVKPFLDKILLNNIQHGNISALRDTLLPKLLSGELRIPDAEKMVEEVV